MYNYLAINWLWLTFSNSNLMDILHLYTHVCKGLIDISNNNINLRIIIFSEWTALATGWPNRLNVLTDILYKVHIHVSSPCFQVRLLSTSIYAPVADISRIYCTCTLNQSIKALADMLQNRNTSKNRHNIAAWLRVSLVEHGVIAHGHASIWADVYLLHVIAHVHVHVTTEV